jgi:hypothetical protein
VSNSGAQKLLSLVKQKPADERTRWLKRQPSWVFEMLTEPCPKSTGHGHMCSGCVLGRVLRERLP